MLEYTPTLIDYSVEQEANYRKHEAKMLDTVTEGKRLTSAYCEAQAKATDSYKEWQKTKQFIELMYEMVNVAKKLANNLDSELRAN